MPDPDRLSPDPTSYPILQRNLPFAEYLAMEAISSTEIREFQRSPRHLQYYWDKPRQPSGAMALGSAVHLALLEPDKIDNIRILDEPPTGKVMREARAKARPEIIILTPDEYERAMKMAERLYEHPPCKFLRDSDTQFELTGWCRLNNETRDLGLKCRMDAVEAGAIWDIKTSRDNADAFAGSVYRYGYWLQAAWYSMIWMLIHGDTTAPPFRFAVVESAPPHGVRVYQMDRDDMVIATLYARRLADRLAFWLQDRDLFLDEVGMKNLGIPRWVTEECYDILPAHQKKEEVNDEV